MGSLEVFVVNASNVPNVEKVGKSDPYVNAEFQGIKKKTEVKKGDLNPTWNEKLIFDLQGAGVLPGDDLKIILKDWERVGTSRLLGQSTVSLKNFLAGQKSQKLSLSLTDSAGRPTACTLNIQITYTPPPGAKTGGSSTGVVVPQVDDQTDSPEQDDEDDDEEEEAFDESGHPVKKKKKKKKRMGAKKSRAPVSDKQQDFQVRIKVVEARQLPGANISPVSRVTCYNQTKQTRIKKSTNSPFWNEVFFFNYFCSPAELFDQMVEFGVYNSRKLRSDALIGSFKCDVGMIWDEAQHSFLHKWLLLSDPDDHMAGAKGYLKICASVLGPGDDAPSFKPSGEEDDEDIESNLLRPAGVQLRPATFKLRLYRAEDIPRMDSNVMQGIKNVFGSKDDKQFVDPYFVFSFAGQEVKSRIIYNNDHPEWNQELRLGLRFPSMCERIKFQLYDWDRISDSDAVATAVVKLNQISSTTYQEGFLPTFGPCYVNFYGSTREYSDLPDEYDDLNLGKGDGVAYRGRVLLELQSVIGEFPEIAYEDINTEDLYKIQKFQRRRKFKLHCTFMNATMISCIDSPTEFEVSIGNYGNKLDEHVRPCASTTQPTNAVFDGCFYHFLPWADNKPCVVVDSHWEDTTFRLEALNFILNIMERLEDNMDKVNTGIKANLPTPELAQLMISLLDVLIVDCKKPLPEIIEGKQIENELDRQMRFYRESELEHIGKEAAKLRENATDVAEAMGEVDNYLAQMKNLSVEPQNSIPDIVIWMISADKRIAFFRCPANLVLWSPNPEFRGKYCGKLETIQLKYPGSKSEKENKWDIPALLRMKVWFGLEKHEHEWHKFQDEGELAVFAETYENQVNILSNWTNKGPTMSRPKFSDAKGKVELNKEWFVPPPGWRWDGDWYINPELSMLFDSDAGHTMFLDDLYECEGRIPAGTWDAAAIAWANVQGDPVASRDDTELPDGWEWITEWEVDVNRAVDEEGWEYCVEAQLGGFGAVEKNYHMCRRRRWLRQRKRTRTGKDQVDDEKLATEMAEGWEYAPLFNMKFHHKERKMDLVRRRRWHRKMVCEDPKAPCFFQFQTTSSDSDSDEEEVAASLAAPRMFLHCHKSNRWQMRAYLYQARDLLAGDSNGLSDPFARIAFLDKSMVTEKLDKTLCPTWDQSLIFENILIHGDAQAIVTKPPEIVVEIFDHDTFGAAEFLGRTTMSPMVKLDPGDPKVPVLQWFPIKKGNQEGGELLAAFELFLMNGKDLPFLPPKRGALYIVPNGIRPVMQRTAIEVMCWGVRNMRKFQLASVTSPSIEFEVGGHVVQSKIIKSTKRNPNFDEPILFFDIMLPKEELYTPPLNLRVRDNRQFGRKPMVGIHVIKSLEEFRRPALTSGAIGDDGDGPGLGNGEMGPGQGHDTIIEMPSGEKGEKERLLSEKISHAADIAALAIRPAKTFGKHPALWDEDIDWWSKFYASTGELEKCKMYLENGYDRLKVYETSLELVEEYAEFNDFCHTFALQRGKSIEEEESSVVGEFKGTFRVYPLPGDPNLPMPQRLLSNLPASAPEECIIRIYIIKAIDLQPNDPSGLADPYVTVTLGKKKANNRDNYIANSLSPVFGKMFELKAVMPLDKDLYIRIKDYDLIGTDDIIGETVIDLENRYLTRFRAICGLPKSYCVSGPCAWRDCQKPKEILEGCCAKLGLPPPEYSGTHSVKIGSRSFHLEDYEQTKPKHTHLGPSDERLALHVLNTFPSSKGLPLVPEHVETRPLFNPLQPGIEQGKLQMWVDIFPQSLGSPEAPVDITPRTPKLYELRIVIWNTVDVILEEESITGEKMSDIYVKGWISGVDEVQETDVHYRSLDGEGNFNWRFVFPFDYLPAEEAMVVKRKEHFWSLDETELHLNPLLMIQIWDNDKFSADDFLGTVELNLNNLPAPTKKASQCSLKNLPDVGSKDVKMVSLFEQKRLRGFWPCYNDESGTKELTGKVEMELELVSAQEVEEKPVGKGRDDPNQHPALDPPNRPETSFLWFTSPWKTFKYIVWKNYKWYFITFIILLFLVVFVILFIYAVPGVSVDYLIRGRSG